MQGEGEGEGEGGGLVRSLGSAAEIGNPNVGRCHQLTFRKPCCCQDAPQGVGWDSDVKVSRSRRGWPAWRRG